MQKFFQSNPQLMIFEKTAQDRMVFKFMFAAGTGAALCAIAAIGCLAFKKVCVLTLAVVPTR